MDAERLKQSVFGCLTLIFCFSVYWALNNWLGSGPAIRELKEYAISIDAEEHQNSSRNGSRIEKLESEVKDLKDEVESLKQKAAR
jgi:hypothetical protein